MIFYIAEIMTKHLWYVIYTSSKVFLLQFSLALPRYQGPTTPHHDEAGRVCSVLPGGGPGWATLQGPAGGLGGEI